MEKVSGELIVEARVDCPYCDWCNDLFLDNSLNYHYELYEGLLADNGHYDNFGNKDLDCTTTCRKCGKGFAVGEITF